MERASEERKYIYIHTHIYMQIKIQIHEWMDGKAGRRETGKGQKKDAQKNKKAKKH